MNDRNQELLQKLKALADRGVDGEQVQARRILDRLLKKYGVAEADLMDEALQEYKFKYIGPRQQSLLVQVCYKITNGDRRVYSYRHGKGSNSEICCFCTKAEAIQIGLEYDFYKELWREEEALFYRAFIYKHRIFRDSPPEKEDEEAGISAEELLRVQLMMQGLQDKEPRLMIAGETPCTANEEVNTDVK